ncbi:MAG TPA: glycosyltransferase family 39 protein, partial [Aggregatilinea sp.]|uniref:ArnT family glycosyltransferase n=1 Tax=Aggregatilinea sp. TaxID=2806333 RepID=UPI002C249EF1
GLGGRRGWIATGAGALALLALAEANGDVLHVEALQGISHHLQFALLAAGCALVAWGLGGAPRPHRIDVPWREVALVGAIALVALILRLWGLGDLVRVLVDENHFTVGIRVFWNRLAPDVKLLNPMPTAASSPYLYSYWQAGAVEALGRTLTGLRAVSAIFGALAIPALYLLARTLFDRRTALVSILILATFPPHLQFSRLGMNIVADPVFGTLALAFLARGLRGGSRLDWAAGGVMLGLTQYFYEAGRLLFPLLALGWLAGGWLVWRPRPALRGALIALLAFLLVAMPIYYTLAGLDFPFFSRLEKTEMSTDYWQRDREQDSLTTRLAHFRQSLMLYVNSPENTTVFYFLYYGGKHPLVLEWFVPLLLLGGAIALWSWRRPDVLPLLWVLAASVGNALLVESAVSARYNVVFPALALLMALGLCHTLPLLGPPRWSPRMQRALALELAVVIMVWQGLFYFGPFLRTFNIEARDYLDLDADDALLRAAALPPGTPVYLIGEKILAQSDAQNFLSYLADDLVVQVIAPEDLTPEALAAIPRDREVAIFAGRNDITTFGRLLAAFGPQSLQYTSNPDVPEAKEFVLYLLPPAGTTSGDLGEGKEYGSARGSVQVQG